MILQSLHIKNYRSVVDSGEIRINSLQAFVGENNAGKSNVLHSIEAFLTPGAAGMQEADFFDKSNSVVITATFSELNEVEKSALRRYLVGEKLILEKHLSLKSDSKSEKLKLESAYHGYVAKPKNWWLSVDQVIEKYGSRPKWEEIAKENGIIDYVRQSDGKVTKASYEAGIAQILREKSDIEYDELVLGETQALGLQPVLLKYLPKFYLLPAITDYADEIAQRSTSTTFRRLMGDLSDRILKEDPRYSEIESSLKKLKCLFNPVVDGEERPKDLCRLKTLEIIENELQKTISRLMPSVEGVSLEVSLAEAREFFSKGVTLKIHDGVLTDVLAKGHGLQRSVVFGLLQVLISIHKGGMLSEREIVENEQSPIILAIEEPELYIHPQMQRIVFGVLRDFSKTDQVIYATHSPTFVDIGNYDSIGVVRKDNVRKGTIIHQCEKGVLGSPEERRGFQLLTSFDLEHNQVFFAKTAVLVEGKEDLIALMAAGRYLSIFSEFPEEIGFTVIVADSKDQIPKFQKILNAFQIPYVVLLEMDGKDEKDEKNKKIIDLCLSNCCVKLPLRLEDVVKHPGHFAKVYDAKKYFDDVNNITDNLKTYVKTVFFK